VNSPKMNRFIALGSGACAIAVSVLGVQACSTHDCLPSTTCVDPPDYSAIILYDGTSGPTIPDANASNDAADGSIEAEDAGQDAESQGAAVDSEPNLDEELPDAPSDAPAD
jgi:hypothetical protein